MIAGFAFIADAYYFFEAREILIHGKNLTDVALMIYPLTVFLSSEKQ
jgi:hypothetical protein